MKRRDLMIGAAAGGLGIQCVASAQADFLRSGTSVRYVVPFPPGGLNDVMARAVAQKLSESWKVPVLVDNRAGGNGQIGAEIVAKGPSDGSQLLQVSLAHAANVSLYPKAGFSLMQDLRPVALMAGSPMLVVVPAYSPIKDFKDLLRVSKERQLNVGSSGNGTPPHLAMSLFADLNHVRMQHIPYKGGAPSITDLIGGQLDAIFSNFPESIAHVKAGKLRALAICSLARSPALPDVPTAAESGMPGLVIENWTAVMTQARTPEPVVERYSREVIKIMFSREMEERAAQQGFQLMPKGHEEFARFYRSEVERWGRIIRLAGITPT